MKSFSILLARPEPVAAAGSSFGERGLPACGLRLRAETDFLLPLALDEFTIPVRSNSDFARAAQTNFSPSIPSRLRYRASSHQMSITRTSAGNSPSLLIAASSLADSKLG